MCSHPLINNSFIFLSIAKHFYFLFVGNKYILLIFQHLQKKNSQNYKTEQNKQYKQQNKKRKKKLKKKINIDNSP